MDCDENVIGLTVDSTKKAIHCDDKDDCNGNVIDLTGGSPLSPPKQPKKKAIHCDNKDVILLSNTINTPTHDSNMEQNNSEGSWKFVPVRDYKQVRGIWTSMESEFVHFSRSFVMRASYNYKTRREGQGGRGQLNSNQDCVPMPNYTEAALPPSFPAYSAINVEEPPKCVARKREMHLLFPMMIDLFPMAPERWNRVENSSQSVVDKKQKSPLLNWRASASPDELEEFTTGLLPENWKLGPPKDASMSNDRSDRGVDVTLSLRLLGS
ncbi:hypothetical protein LWI28_017955 [Acer negundo]|uniref:Uncharacterized protein n=1 Tax=Acer negundo TaxID=4023 RepID=A0AAD5NL31_ACENE|nr:hypothetical protein LWI28_017955 [Acer negundo]